MALRRGFKAEAERRVTTIWDQVGADLSHPIDVDAAATTLDARIVIANTLVPEARLRELEGVQAYAFSACTFDVRGKPVIALNSVRSPGRQRADGAHGPELFVRRPARRAHAAAEEGRPWAGRPGPARRLVRWSRAGDRVGRRAARRAPAKVAARPPPARHPPARRAAARPPGVRPATIAPMEIMGVTIRTILSDNVARRCAGCGEVVDGTPWRVNLLDIVATETPVSWAARPAVNPGPFQFHGDPTCVRRWMAAKGYLFCRRGDVREIMRPVPLPPAGGAPADAIRWGLCDGIHRDDHEFVPA